MCYRHVLSSCDQFLDLGTWRAVTVDALGRHSPMLNVHSQKSVEAQEKLTSLLQEAQNPILCRFSRPPPLSSECYGTWSLLDDTESKPKPQINRLQIPLKSRDDPENEPIEGVPITCLRLNPTNLIGSSAVKIELPHIAKSVCGVGEPLNIGHFQTLRCVAKT